MGWLVAVIPIACCVLIPAAVAAVAFLGLGKKNKSISNVRDHDVLQESSRYSTPWRHRTK